MFLQIKCAYVEIYNEEIKDLLHPDTPSKSISIREDANGDIVLAGVKEEVVTNFESMIRYPLPILVTKALFSIKLGRHFFGNL